MKLLIKNQIKPKLLNCEKLKKKLKKTLRIKKLKTKANWTYQLNMKCVFFIDYMRHAATWKVSSIKKNKKVKTNKKEK